ncbi:MAG TPA: hypothetical protein VFU50_21020 [Terriglobales bacterium]|nr:hypothetical protein [Terriglobales bacterium]
MLNNPQQREQSTPTDCKVHQGKRGLSRLGKQIHRSREIVLTLLACSFFTVALPTSAQTIGLATSGAGITFSGPNPANPTPTYHAGFGAVNGLGIGNPIGLQKIAVAGGEFYYTPYTIVLNGANPGHPAEVDAYISSAFSNSSSVIQLMSCAYPGPCNTFASYTALPNTQAADIVVLPLQTTSTNYTAYLGILVQSFNGSIVSPDTATVMFDVYDNRHGIISHTLLNLDTPGTTIQKAIQLQLATAPSGLPISAGGTTDYAANFGTVNGLGVGPGAGLTVINGQAPGGVIYSTPYLLQPAFSGFSSFSNTKITVYVSTDFVHPAVLKLYDSQSQFAGYNAISKSSGAPTQITGNASNGSSITEYLGLFVSNANGGGSFTGADKATLTYTITVQ